MTSRGCDVKWTGCWIGIRTGLAAAALLALAACGGEDSGSTMAEEGSGETPPVSAAREGAEGTSGQPPEVAECLDLVEAGELGRALSVCAEAAKAAPQNAEVQDALEEARAAAGDAAAAAEESAEDAKEKAKGAFGDMNN